MLLLDNVRIYPGFGSQIFRGALAIHHHRIHALIPNGCKKACLKRIQKLNLQGRWVGPAFTDSHIHLTALARSLSRLTLDGMNRKEVISALKQAAGIIPQGEWILGRGWERQYWDDSSEPTRKDIDPVTPLHPVALTSKDGHTLLLNSRAIERLNIPDHITDPPGGRFDRDTRNELTGIVRETAVDLIRGALPVPGAAKRKASLQSAMKLCHSLGITAVHSFEQPDDWRFLMSMARDETWTLKVVVYLPAAHLNLVRDHFREERKRYRKVQLKGIKLFADGALGSRTALLSRPYASRPVSCGMEVTSREEMTRVCVKAARDRIPCAIHAIGDLALSHAVAAQTAARSTCSDLWGARIEHVQLASLRDIEVMAEHGIAASVQPFHLLSDYNMVMREWADHGGLKYPYRTLMARRVKTVFGSDAPIDELNPFKIIAAAIRRVPEGAPPDREIIDERIEFAEAFAAATERPAEIESPAPSRGRLEPGRSADIMVLDENPFEVSVDRLSEMRVRLLISGGDLVFGNWDEFLK